MKPKVGLSDELRRNNAAVILRNNFLYLLIYQPPLYPVFIIYLCTLTHQSIIITLISLKCNCLAEQNDLHYGAKEMSYLRTRSHLILQGLNVSLYLMTLGRSRFFKDRSAIGHS
jgi:hypothetical protein